MGIYANKLFGIIEYIPQPMNWTRLVEPVDDRAPHRHRTIHDVVMPDWTLDGGHVQLQQPPWIQNKIDLHKYCIVAAETSGHTYLSFCVQKLGLHIVTDKPFLLFHNDIAGWLVRCSTIGRPNGYLTSSVNLNRTMKFK